MPTEILCGDNLPILREMPDNSVDAIVTDPPYGLSFMGRKWDYDVPSVELWAECLRVLKPGGHLLAFAGTRTQHRMAVRIEDAGFEIRDMIAWVYGSGFPKSHDVSKAIDREAGAERADAVTGGHMGISAHGGDCRNNNAQAWHAQSQHGQINKGLLTRGTPITDAAKQWDGWGSALKPSFETVTFATKPLDAMGYCAIMITNLTERIESCRHNAKNAVKSLERSRADLPGGKINTAHASVATDTGEVPANKTATGPEDATHLKADTSASTLEAEGIALNTFLSWRRILEGVFNAVKTSTTLTAFETTIDWKILSYCLLQVTPDIIIQARCNPNGLNPNALRAVTYLNASLASCESILALFAVAPAMSQEAEACRGEDVKPNLDPCILARKPLAERTIAANVLTWGTGGVNVDGCRIDRGAKTGGFPANLIHDGSDEVVRLFPVTGPSKAAARNNGEFKSVAKGRELPHVTYGHDDQGGSAARFFYCAKASRSEREAGLEGDKCTHPTVKPIALMRYLCRLVTPPGGIVLDPFTGSGTTGCAATLEGFGFVGIEREAEYAEIARRRVEHWRDVANQDEASIEDVQEKLFVEIG